MTLLYFILGGIFVAFILPLLDSLATLIATKIEVWKAKMNVDISKCAIEIENLSTTDNNTERAPAIGFAYPDVEYIYEEEEEE